MLQYSFVRIKKLMFVQDGSESMAVSINGREVCFPKATYGTTGEIDGKP
jgi:hypothetical protein